MKSQRKKTFWWDHLDGSFSRFIKTNGIVDPSEFNPNGNWAHFGPLIDLFKIEISHAEKVTVAAGVPDENGHVEWQVGTNAKEAGCRAVVSTKYDEIEIPDELIGDINAQ